MNKEKLNNMIEESFKEMKKQFHENVDYLKEILNKKDEFSTFVEYLLTTDRSPCSITNECYSQIEISSFVMLVHLLHHALYDDGDITFYTLNGEPKFIFNDKNEMKRKDFLTPFLINLEKDMNFKYKIKILDNDLIKWIKLSEKYHIKNIKECFINDIEMIGKEDAIKIYKDYRCFDENWINLN